MELSSTTLRSAPLAFAYWFGLAGEDRRDNGFAKILTFHSTPARRVGVLERQLRYLSRRFDIVPLAEIVRVVADRGARPGRRLALTFDDGLRNNVRVLYPVLKRLGIPATFFVCPGLIEENACVWSVETRLRLDYLRPGIVTALARELGAPAGNPDLVTWMKTLPNDARLQAQDRIRRASAGFVPSAAQREESELAGWDELRGLDPRIVTVGSHTMTHPILARCTPEQATWELAESRRAIEEKLQRSVEFFAYPNGDEEAIVPRLAAQHYRASVTTHESWVAPGCDLAQLPRVSVPLATLRLVWNLHLTAYEPRALAQP